MTVTTATAATGTSYLDSLRTATKSATAGAGNATIDQSGFLKLLTTQLTHQDPTQPQDPSAMTQQLAELSSTSGITEMNASLKSLLSEVTGNRIGDAASWIGKSALVASGTAQPRADGSYAGQVTLPSAASRLSISLQDATGATVYSQSLANQAAGPVDFAWNGQKADGTTATGPLTVVVSATGASGTITPTVSTWATVTGVQSPAGGSAAQVSTTNGTVAPGDVLSLS